MKLWIKYAFVPYWRTRIDRFWHWCARHAPKKLRYWCVIVAAVRTTGTYPGESTSIEILEGAMK